MTPLKLAPIELERACLSAWPPLTRDIRDGWVRQAALGRSWRVNSVWPLEWTGETDLPSAIAEAAAWCRAQGVKPCFKLADGAVAPPQLPEALAEAGYAPSMETLVLTRALQDCAAPARVALQPEPDERVWAPLRDSAPSPEDYAERRGVVERIKEPLIFARAQYNGEDAAIGVGVLSGELLGFYLMRTAPRARQRGLARDIVRALSAWGAGQGAQFGYLQVEAANAPALALYESEGFALSYRYLYWTAPDA
jgi:GNAT superfamily N-acetyltransferase